ncbi:MAG TPA: sugar phosphate isomerase/epimerase [Mobilitalea sp.]|nr:sugar phosphate isomerase/epimerase [Mobilitalea sp.]
MFLAGRNQVIPNRSLVETMHMLHNIGYGGMELSIVRGLYPVLAMDYMDDYVIEKVNEVSDNLSFPITAVACHQNYVTDELTLQAQKKLLQTAKKYRTDVVIMSTFIDYQVRENNPDIYKLLAEKTKELCKVAEDNGVKIAIEVEPNQLFHNLNRFFDIVDQVNSPALKLNFDVGHIYLSEVDLDKAIERTKDYIVYSHINNMCMGEHCHKLPWEGDIDLLAVYRKLKQTCYDGPVSLDIYLQNYEEVAPKCLEFINREVFLKL